MSFFKRVYPQFNGFNRSILVNSKVGHRSLHNFPVRTQAIPRLLSPRSIRTSPPKRLYSSAVDADGNPNSSKRPLGRFFNTILIACISGIAGIAFALPPGAIEKYERMVNPPTEAETLKLFTASDDESAKVDEYIKNHPIAQALRANPHYIESRPHMAIPESQRQRNFTAGTLAGPGKIVVPPYIFSENSGQDMTSISYLGQDVCGYQGVVHGGLLATMLDEGLARCCFPALPNKIGMTANLNINYRKPAPAGSYYVLRAKTTKVEGRKAWVEGRIESLVEDGQEPQVFVEASALFIEPKNAQSLRRVFPIKGDNIGKDQK
ncbi:MAG: hypothetical protein M4579_007093 [Chaenotheca gracillima]|nr:MAG: hypothetical protein M4579_007093 [Chaenotheca gracillima]